MRDHPHHTYKILGGMWGFNCTLGRYNFYEDINKFMKVRNYKFKRMDDMYFLNTLFDDCLKKHSVLQHDTFFNNKWGISHQFPECEFYKTNKYYSFIGEIFNENSVPPYKYRDTNLIESFKKK